MMNPSEELFTLAVELEKAGNQDNDRELLLSLDKIVEVSDAVGKSFCGSWLGYHSRVYYDNFLPIPAGVRFNQEWGLQKNDFSRTEKILHWREYTFDKVIEYICVNAGNPNLSVALQISSKNCLAFDRLKSEIISILEIELSKIIDPYLSKLKAAIEKLQPKTKLEIADSMRPQGEVISRDIIAINQNIQIPPHIYVAAEAISIQHSFTVCLSAADIARKAGSHLERKAKKDSLSERIGTNIFIGHGRSDQWRVLKDFIQDRLNLPWDEFNRIPVAGITNQTRLSEMLDSAAIAFLIMTAEDETTGGDLQARMNVIHEAGLFQGRLGFTKAIVLLEDGCAEFSNIQGIGQIRFPKDNIKAAFEEIRAVLERENLL